MRRARTALAYLLTGIGFAFELVGWGCEALASLVEPNGEGE